MTGEDEPLHPKVGDPEPPVSRRGHLLALAVLVFSLVLTLSTWRYASERETVAAEAEFMRATEGISTVLLERMINYEIVLKGGAALFASVSRPTPHQWQAYADGMSIRDRFPATVGLGFGGYVPHARLPALQVEWRDSGYGLLDVVPHGRRRHYGPILYLEPRTPENVAAVGYDMYSEPVRREAMDAALETGSARLSGPVQLVQDSDVHSTAVVLYVPIYRNGVNPKSLAARREAMQGWVYMPLRMRRFVESALGSQYRNARFSIHDITGDVDRLMYASGQEDAGPPAFQHRTIVEQYGRRWRLSFESPPRAQAIPRLNALHAALALGLLASVLLSAIVWVLARTERRARKIAGRMTEEYQRSEERFRTAMHYSAIGKALLDSQGCVVEANPALGQIVGLEPRSLIGAKFESLFEDEVPDLDAWLQQEGEQADAVRRSTRSLHRAGGLPRHAQLTYARVPGNVGQDVSGLVQVEDVTERIRAEARAIALTRTLEARVAVRTRELSQANQEMESFAYSISHDLRAPLRAIDGFSRILMEQHAERLDEAGRGYLARVRSAAGRMGELIDALLKMSRVTRTELKLVDVDLSQLASDVIDELAAGDDGHPPEVEIMPGLHVRGDATLLHNLLDNLLGNAWKFTRGREGARIEFGAAQVGGEHAEGGHAGTVEYYVRDNGAGFPQAYVEKLFRPFQRLHSQDEFPGHGIGLASVRRIVERHGGSIRAEGEVGQGAIFTFTLPGEALEGRSQ